MDGVDLFSAHSVCEHAEKVRAVRRKIGEAVSLDRHRAQIEKFPGLAGVPEADLLALQFAGQRFQVIEHTQLVQRAVAVGAEIESGADLLQLVRLLVEVDVEAELEQGEGSRQAADAGSGNQNVRISFPHRANLARAGCTATAI